MRSHENFLDIALLGLMHDIKDRRMTKEERRAIVITRIKHYRSDNQPDIAKGIFDYFEQRKKRRLAESGANNESEASTYTIFNRLYGQNVSRFPLQPLVIKMEKPLNPNPRLEPTLERDFEVHPLPPPRSFGR